jgi:hypothetical protein
MEVQVMFCAVLSEIRGETRMVRVEIYMVSMYFGPNMVEVKLRKRLDET